MAYGPQQQLYAYQFAMNFLYSPRQNESRFYPRVMQEDFSSAQRFIPILPQIDGIDFDPYTTTTSKEKIFGGPPFQQFDVKRIGFQRRAHTINHAVARTHLHQITPDYRSVLAGLFAGSSARFKDRVLLFNADGDRVVQNSVTPSALSTSMEAFPENNKYYIAGTSNNAIVESFLDLQTLLDMKLRFLNNEIYSASGMDPICIASPSQIQNLLTNDKITSADYNTVKTLVRGEVNSFMGFEFVFCKAGQALAAAPPLYRRSTAATFVDRGDVKNAATTGYAQVTTQPEKVIFTYPYEGFSAGEIPSAMYMNVWENPIRLGTWEYIYQTMLGYRRTQNEYTFVAYGKKATSTGVAIRQTPTKQGDYFDTYSSTAANWDYDATAA